MPAKDGPWSPQDTPNYQHISGRDNRRLGSQDVPVENEGKIF